MSDVIADALAAHADSGSTSMDSLGNTVISVDPIESSDTPDTTVVDTAGTTDPAVTPVEGGAQAAAVAQDEIDKLLESEGVKAPQAGVRENRIPYSQTKRIIANAKKKWETDYDAKAAPQRQQFEQIQTRVNNYAAAERLASTNPDQYIAALAAVDPRYAKFVNGSTVPGMKSPAEVKDTDPEPQPDKDPATGQLYYTPEKWAQVQAWNRRQAVKDAQSEFEKKYGPVLSRQVQQEQARADYERRVPVVQAQMKRLNDTFGAEMVKQNETAIIQEMKRAEAQGVFLSPSEAAAAVLIPKLRADEASVRAKVLAEVNGRPAAARGQTVPQVRTEDPDNRQALSGEALIKAELDRVMPSRNR